MRIHGKDKLKFCSLAAKVLDFPWAVNAVLRTNGFPFPAFYKIAGTVPRSGGQDAHFSN
jgi:hypothetical protein